MTISSLLDWAAHLVTWRAFEFAGRDLRLGVYAVLLDKPTQDFVYAHLNVAPVSADGAAPNRVTREA